MIELNSEEGFISVELTAPVERKGQSVGKIDEGNRERIAKNIPHQLLDQQIIFLVTNSEYTSVFKEFLENKIATKISLTYNAKSGGIDIN